MRVHKWNTPIMRVIAYRVMKAMFKVLIVYKVDQFVPLKTQSYSQSIASSACKISAAAVLEKGPAVKA